MKGILAYLAANHTQPLHPVPLTFFSWYWLIWAIIGFFPVEIYGLIRNSQDTLSYQIWHLESINLGDPWIFSQWTWVHWTLGAVWFFGFIWLMGHFIFGIWH